MILRSCPFCGAGDKELLIVDNGEDHRDQIFVICFVCKAQGPQSPSESDACALWNCHGRSPEQRAQIVKFMGVAGVLRRDEPPTWTDLSGVVRVTIQHRGPLKFQKCKAHGALRELVFARDNNTCQNCGAKAQSLDHIISRRNGGSHHPKNLQALCWSCNSGKAALVDTGALNAHPSLA